MRRASPFAAGLLLLLVAAPSAPAAPAGAPPYDDLLFAAVDAAFRAAFDDEGDLWYTTEGGLVHVDVPTGARELLTAVEGLPSSYAAGLAVRGDKVYVATDGGLGVVDRRTGAVSAVTSDDAPLPARSAQEVAVDGEDVWVGTRIGGVARWNTTTGEWSVTNTSTRNWTPPFPVRRIVPGAADVWVATEGDGLWRLDRASGAWSRLGTADGLASMTVLSLAEDGPLVWVGTDAGLQRWNRTSGAWRAWGLADGMPHLRVLDVDLVVNAEGGTDVWASTPRGAWQLDPATGLMETHGTGFGLAGAYVFDNVPGGARGWAFATERGVSHFLDGAWRHHRTGAGVGPFTNRILAADQGDGGPYLWFGTHQGLAAFRRPTLEEPGRWHNLGLSQRYPGGPVNAVDTEGNTTWLATNNGTFGYDREANRWVSRVVEGTRNLVYGLDADRGKLWVAFFGEGLLMQDLATGAARTWNRDTALSVPDANLLDVRVAGDDVWIGAARGLIRMDRITGAVEGFYAAAEGIPGGTVYRVLPDGPVVWLGTQRGGVARFDVAQGRVTQAWNATTTPGFTHPDVRALHREGDRLWAGTLGGLWRLDLSTGEDRVYNASNSGLVQDFVGGVTSADGLLYVATYSGVARMDLATGEFLPMRDGPGVLRGAPPATAVLDPARVATVSVRIASPREGAAVAGQVVVKGTALSFGGRVDRVEVKVGEGPWETALGTEEWSHAWDASAWPPGEPVVVRARALSGPNVSREAEVVLTPVETPATPLALDDLSPDAATAGRAFPVTIRLQGDPPLSATAYYKANPHAPAWTALPLARQGATWGASIPARDVREGELLYYVEARGGPLSLAAPEDPAQPVRVPVGPPPRLAVSLAGPASWRADAGTTTLLPLVVRNEGSEPASIVLAASGLRAAWVTLPAEPLALAPGANATVEATLAVPAEAFSDETSLAFEAREPGGAALAAAQVPLEVVAKPDGGGPAPATKGTPLPAPLLAPLLAALLLVLRRRRA